MLPKLNRLKQENDFKKILKGEKSVKGDLLILKTAKNDVGRIRVGISVSKKVSPKASVRNKIRRRLIAQLEAKAVRAKGGLDIFLIVLPGMENKNFSEIKEMCDKLFKKARIWENFF